MLGVALVLKYIRSYGIDYCHKVNNNVARLIPNVAIKTEH